VAGNTGSDQHGSIDGGNDIEGADLPRLLGQQVTAAGAMFGGDERVMRQLLQYFGHQRRGDAVLLGNFAGTASVLLAVHRQVLDGNQTVVGLFGKLEHRSRDFLNTP
jgi:hypothetical protein